MHRLGLFMVAIATAIWIAPAVAETRVALVIGNGAYTLATPLSNATNDAEDVAAKLSAIGFDVHSGLNLSGEEMRALLVRFGRAAAEADIALFYYAGHGIQSTGENYLVPVDAEIRFEDEIELMLIPLQSVLSQLSRARSSRLVFLDACRNNPFERQLMQGMRGAAPMQGLSQPRALPDTYIAYATQPGAVASDGAGRNSPFTAALLRHIEQPGLNIHETMLRVSRDVRDASDGKQEPWAASSLRNSFFFVPGLSGTEAAMVEYEAAHAEGSESALLDFIDRHGQRPESALLVAIARREIERQAGRASGAAAVAGDGAATVDAAALGGADLFIEARGGRPLGFSSQVRWALAEGIDGAVAVAGTAITGNVDFPGDGLSARVSIGVTADASLPAAHIVEVEFDLPDDFTDGTIDQMQGVLLATEAGKPGVALKGAAARVRDNHFILALYEGDARAANEQLLSDGSRLDIAVTFTSGRRAILSLEKGATGNEVFAEALDAWRS